MKVRMTLRNAGGGYRPTITPEANAKRMCDPQWSYRESEVLLFERVKKDEEHHGQQCEVERKLMGYLDDSGAQVDTRGGAYFVRFACGCSGLAFEHELRRHGEGSRIQ